MPTTDILSNLPPGPYVLTSSGELGTYDAHGRLCVDAPLSQAFAEHNKVFLRDYLRDPQADDRRLAVLYNASAPRPWGRLIFSLEDVLVHELYPAGGRANGGFTAFQQKNREKSLFRGIELVLDYRRDSAPTVPVYCPVLFNGRATLAARASALGREPHVEEREVPAIDVLNLVATLPQGRRTAPAVHALMDRLRQALIRKDMRNERQFALMSAEERLAALESAEDAFDELARERRLRRNAGLAGVDARRLHETQHIDSVERWLRIPYEPVDSARLRSFVLFRALDEISLAVLAARSFVYAAPPGTRLLERGMSDAWNLFLLGGGLLLTPTDGATLRVDGGADTAARAIATLKPRKYTVETLTPVSFLWVHDLLLEAVLNDAALAAVRQS